MCRCETRDDIITPFSRLPRSRTRGGSGRAGAELCAGVLMNYRAEVYAALCRSLTLFNICTPSPTAGSACHRTPTHLHRRDGPTAAYGCSLYTYVLDGARGARIRRQYNRLHCERMIRRAPLRA